MSQTQKGWIFEVKGSDEFFLEAWVVDVEDRLIKNTANGVCNT